MPKLTTMISAWLWAGIFTFIYLLIYNSKEIKKAELKTVHFCVLLFLCCIGGIYLFIECLIADLKKDDPEKILEKIKELKEKIDDLVEDIRKF